MTSLFSQLRDLAVIKSPDPVETKVQDDKGKITRTTSTFDEIVFQEKVKIIDKGHRKSEGHLKLILSLVTQIL